MQGTSDDTVQTGDLREFAGPRVLGMHSGFRAVATGTDSGATFSALPSGKIMKVRVTAANNMGESLPSAQLEAGVG